VRGCRPGAQRQTHLFPRPVLLRPAAADIIDVTATSASAPAPVAATPSAAAACTIVIMVASAVVATAAGKRPLTASANVAAAATMAPAAAAPVMLLLRCFAAGVTAAVGLGTQGRPCSSTQTAVGTHCSDSTDPIRMCCVKPQVAVTQCFGAVVQQAYKTQK
jgi:hypothetical protein